MLAEPEFELRLAQPRLPLDGGGTGDVLKAPGPTAPMPFVGRR
jgi:hypothetical protein